MLYTHEQSTVAKINKSKSKDLLLGRWNTSIDVLIIPYIAEKNSFKNAITRLRQPKLYSIKSLD